MIPNWENFSIYLYFRRKLDKSNDDSYKHVYGVICKFFQDKEFTLNNIDHFFAVEQARNMSNSTLNNYLKMLKHLAKFMDLKILDDYTYFKKIQPTYRILTDEECRKLEKCYIERDHCDSELVNQRYSTLIHVLARTGMRINEVLSLKWEDIMPDRIVVKAENNKTDNTRQIPIVKETYNLIYKLPKFDYVFGTERGKMDDNSINKELKLRAKFLRIKDFKDIHCHQFRHYFATSLLRSGISIALVARLLGHSDISTTDHYYSHYLIDDLISAVETHPLNAHTISFQTIKEKVRRLALTIENTNHHLLLSEKGDMIILEIQDGQH